MIVVHTPMQLYTIELVHCGIIIAHIAYTYTSYTLFLCMHQSQIMFVHVLFSSDWIIVYKILIIIIILLLYLILCATA